jgi:hypothetical protein
VEGRKIQIMCDFIKPAGCRHHRAETVRDLKDVLYISKTIFVILKYTTAYNDANNNFKNLLIL